MYLFADIVLNPDFKGHDDYEAVFDAIITGAAYFVVTVHNGGGDNEEYAYYTNSEDDLQDFRTALIDHCECDEFFSVMIVYSYSDWRYLVGSRREWGLSLQLLSGISDPDKMEVED